jgi:L-2,4-diaminobutyrate decarboxylase
MQKRPRLGRFFRVCGLHPDVAPVASQIEHLLVSELATLFGQSGGHFTSGSTLANLTALWAVRKITCSQTVVSSDASGPEH